MFNNFCLFIKVVFVMEGKMGFNFFIGGGGSGVGCVFIFLIIFEVV